jgi:tungstate transport system substrate-binding protein
MAVNPDKHPGVKYDAAMQFVEWIRSPETQKQIAAFGADKFGQPLFHPGAAQ